MLGGRCRGPATGATPTVGEARSSVGSKQARTDDEQHGAADDDEDPRALPQRRLEQHPADKRHDNDHEYRRADEGEPVEPVVGALDAIGADRASCERVVVTQRAVAARTAARLRSAALGAGAGDGADCLLAIQHR